MQNRINKNFDNAHTDEIFHDYPDIINIPDLCKMLRISRRMAYNLINSKQLPYRKIGRIYKIRKLDVEKFMHP